MSLMSTNGLVSPDATVETMTLGTPSGPRAHRRRADSGAARAADRKHAEEFAAFAYVP
jgi:hypothetical protein